MEITVMVQIFAGIVLVTECSAVALNDTLIKGAELNDLKANVTEIKDSFVGRVKEANSRLEQCENQIERYGEQIENLEAVIVDMQRRFHDMVSHMGQVDANNRELADETEKANSDILQLRRTISKLQTQLESRNNDKEMMKSAAFSAYGIHSDDGQEVNLDARDPIIYHHIATNPGGHYNATTGEYTCPVSGLYFFQFSIYGHHVKNEGSSIANAILLRDGNPCAETLMINFGYMGIHNTMTNGVVVQCNAGQRIWVQGVHGNNHLFNWNALNRFSGFLISMEQRH